MAELFGKGRTTITEHIQNVFNEGELEENVVCRNFRHTTQHGAIEGKTQETTTKYYNLDVIISVGYRVKSPQGTQFRIWATQRLKEYIIKGFTLNDERFKSGSSMNYFNELQERIREIRISERFFYQKIKDIYTTSIDYDAKDERTIEFFKVVQNKLLWAISQQTAAELVYRRVDASLPLMGMQSLDKKNTLAVKKTDISIAKNYLKEDEIKLLGLLVEQYLAFAETMAQQRTPMYMADWIKFSNTPQMTITNFIQIEFYSCYFLFNCFHGNSVADLFRSCNFNCEQTIGMLHQRIKRNISIGCNYTISFLLISDHSLSF